MSNEDRVKDNDTQKSRTLLITALSLVVLWETGGVLMYSFNYFSLSFSGRDTFDSKAGDRLEKSVM